MASHQARVLLTKSFIDSHDRAIKTIATALRDAGMEVVLVDYQTADDIVTMAVDEDVDVVGISFMSGGQVDTTSEVVRLLADSGAADVPIVVGGTIRPFDVSSLTELGVAAIFRGGETLASVSSRFAKLAQRRQRIDG